VSTGIWILLVAVVVALAFGSYRAVSDGRFRGTHRVRGAVATDESTDQRSLADAPWAAQLGERATLVQFSSAFCAPCRATRRVLEQAVSAVPGATHVEVDAEQHLDVVRRFGIMRTPTTLVLDPRGHEVTRATGVPTREQVLAALAQAVD
jgi:thiol-disulfide isomerase/thioredoxin